MNAVTQILADGFPSLAAMGEMLRSGTCSSLDLTEHALRRIQLLDGRLHC